MNRTTWDTSEALRARAQRDADEAAGPCPHCGAKASVVLLCASTYDEVRWLPGAIRCSERCYERDPDGYLDSVLGAPHSTACGHADIP